MKVSSKHKEYLAIFFVTVIWGSAFSFVERALQTFNPFQLIIARFIPVLPIFLIIIFKHRKELKSISTKDWILLSLSGFSAVFLYNFALFTGQKFVNASIASLVISLNPPTIIAGAILLRGEKVSRNFLFGVVVALLGMIILSLSKDQLTFDWTVLFGILILLGCPISWAAYTLLLTNTVKRNNPLLITALSVAIGSITLIPMIPIGFPQGDFQFGFGWLYALYLGIFSTLVGFILWNWLLLQRGAARTGIVVYLNTLWGVLLAVLWLGEPITLQILIGAGCILIGVTIAKKFG
ncbi:MAG: DMT family transporter [bacterium]|nr:DMT family transporter [bacterium]